MNNVGNCLQLCTNTVGSCFVCSCNTGYTLSADQRKMYWLELLSEIILNNNDDTIEKRARVNLVQLG